MPSLVRTLAVALLVTSTAYACDSIPLCCATMYDGPSPEATQAIQKAGVPSSDIVYPIGVGCIPTENPPATYILTCNSPDTKACCDSSLQNGLAYNCTAMN
ncbi:hypothetical protein CONPUDRAFT_159617 [Coniophora puteana RWD-64-598 SS2]|uniref:Hydrophobin n=1 Tax=Coniophora puteana (strain RWD-64-598) TaxID=741705 RepID=A0A5M3M6Z8_CONPW|nr:uncharacterized protein CONPUDRAFT_159617 [Coniophora puteana RWD-64-598 SS2]EIW74843.1 hypothetical protein CONPUDRAFT_159617 [Coniophora puteana RWD-64-598 SS2]